MASDDKDDPSFEPIADVLRRQEASRLLAAWAAACFGYEEVTPETMREILQRVDAVPTPRAAILATQVMKTLDRAKATDAEKFYAVALVSRQLREVAKRKKT